VPLSHDNNYNRPLQLHEASTDSRIGAQRNLLIVDDSPDILDVLTAIFTEEGYSVSTCSNYDEAIASLSTEKVDLLITDLRLPHGDGIGLIRHIEQHISQPPKVILLTAARVSLESEEFQGLVDKVQIVLVTKPFDVDALLTTVHDLLHTAR